MNHYLRHSPELKCQSEVIAVVTGVPPSGDVGLSLIKIN